jgi:TadE-like protein
MAISFLQFRLLRAKKKSFLKNQNGVAAVEFALVGPLFLLMLYVIFETGIMLFSEYSIQASVQEAGRLVRTGQTQQPQTIGGQQVRWDAAEFKKYICSKASIASCQQRLVVYMQGAPNFATLASQTPSFANLGPGNFPPPSSAPPNTPPKAPFDCGEPREAMALIVTYDWPFFVTFAMSAFSNINDKTKRRLVAYTLFRNEPYPAPVASQSCQASP